MSFALFMVLAVLMGEWVGEPYEPVPIVVIPATPDLLQKSAKAFEPVVDYSAIMWFEGHNRSDWANATLWRHGVKHNATLQAWDDLRNLSFTICGASVNLKQLRGCVYYEWLRWHSLPWERIGDKPIPLVRQRMDAFCVPALAASISLFYGMNYTQDEIAASMNTNPVSGSRWVNQVQWFYQHGFNVTLLSVSSREEALNNLRGVKAGSFGIIWIKNPAPENERVFYHSVAVIGGTDYYLDPAGFFRYLDDGLFELWPKKDGSYSVLVVSQDAL